MRPFVITMMLLLVMVPGALATHNAAGVARDPVYGAFQEPFLPFIKNHTICSVLAPHRLSITDQSVVPIAPVATTGYDIYICNASSEWSVPVLPVGAPAELYIDSSFAFSSRPTEWDGTAGLPIDKIRSSCCPQGQCWDGAVCIENQSSLSGFAGTVEQPPGSGKNWRCLSGEWSDATPKVTWDNAFLGFCQEKDPEGTADDAAEVYTNDIRRCLVTPPSSDALRIEANDHPERYPDVTPACIKSEQYIEDHLCDVAGNWTSRTKLLALSMLAIAQNPSSFQQFDPTPSDTYVTPYTLACDDVGQFFQDFTPLQFMSYDATTGRTVCAAGDSTVPCFNNFCVLTVRGIDRSKVSAPAITLTLVGTSLNVPPHGDGTSEQILAVDPQTKQLVPFTSVHSFLQVINPLYPPAACDAVSDTNADRFQACNAGTAPGVYYQKKHNLILYTPNAPSLQSLAPLNDAVLEIPKASVITTPYLGGTCPSVTQCYSVFAQRNSINTLYAAENKATKLFGFIEQGVSIAPAQDASLQVAQTDFIGIRYEGNQFNVCGFMQKNVLDTSIFCKPDPATDASGNPVYPMEVNIRTGGPGKASSNDVLRVYRDLTVKLRP